MNTSIRYDTVTHYNTDKVGILHKTKSGFHTFNIDDAISVLDFALDKIRYLDIFTNTNPGTTYQKLWLGKPVFKKWNGGYLYFRLDKRRSYGDKYLVFKCPCHDKENHNNQCLTPICAMDFLDMYLKDSIEYDRLKHKIDTLKNRILSIKYDTDIKKNKVNEAEKTNNDNLIINKTRELKNELNKEFGTYQKKKNIKKSEKHIEDNNMAVCPKCKHVIYRVNGCRSMSCNYCGVGFCYNCSEEHQNGYCFCYNRIRTFEFNDENDEREYTYDRKDRDIIRRHKQEILIENFKN